MGKDAVGNVLNLMRRLRISDIEKNTEYFVRLLPEHKEELLSSIDRPLKTLLCPKTNKRYIICEYNRYEGAYRSPWSGEYTRPVKGVFPSQNLREFEIILNEAFEVYARLYYENAVSSVYTWDTSEGFAMTVLMNKTLPDDKSIWDSIHVIGVNETENKVSYNMTSTIIICLDSNCQESDLELSGSFVKQTEMQTEKARDLNSHLKSVGTLVENFENSMHNYIRSICFGNLKYFVNRMRKHLTYEEFSEIDKQVYEELSHKISDSK